MANNLDASIGIDTKKLTADIAVAKQTLTQAGKEFAQALKRGASTAQIDLLSGAVDTAKKHLIELGRTATVGYSAYGKAATEAAQASMGLAKSNKAVEESSRGATREVFKLSREFGNLEFSAFNAAKAFREFPKVAVPLAAAAGAIAAAGKVVDDAAERIQKLENLHEATGMAKEDIKAIEKGFINANVEAAKAEPLLRRLSEQFNKAHLGAAGMETALAGGVNVLRGGSFRPGQTPTRRQMGEVTVLGGSRDQQSGVFDEQGNKIWGRNISEPFPGVRTPAYDEQGNVIGIYRGAEAHTISGFGAFDSRNPPQPEKGFGGLVDPSQFAQTAKGFNDWFAAVAKVLQNLQRTPEGQAIARIAAGAEGGQPEETLRAFGQFAPKERPPALPTERAPGEVPLGRGPGEVPIGRAEPPAPQASKPQFLQDLRDATKQAPELAPGGALKATQYGVAQKEAEEALAASGTQAGLNVMDKSTKALEKSAEALTGLQQGLKDFHEWVPKQAEMAPKGAEDFGKELSNATTAIGNFSSALSSAIQELNKTPAPAAEAPIPPSGMAFGGTVPGSGSGDTVPAMLTPGEFVNRKSSVGYYGSNVFRALNAQMIPRELFRGYAFGGLVDSFHSPAHFAEGGMVSAASTPVAFSLHLSGKEFLAHASAPVADRLVKEARAQSMRSAGVKPSWVS